MYCLEEMINNFMESIFYKHSCSLSDSAERVSLNNLNCPHSDLWNKEVSEVLECLTRKRETQMYIIFCVFLPFLFGVIADGT